MVFKSKTISGRVAQFPNHTEQFTHHKYVDRQDGSYVVTKIFTP